MRRRIVVLRLVRVVEVVGFVEVVICGGSGMWR